MENNDLGIKNINTAAVDEMETESINVPEIIDANCMDQVMEDEEIRSEAVFRFKVENISKLQESILSQPCYVRSLPWKIMAMPREIGGTRGQPETKTLGFFLQCNGENDSPSWTCDASAELRLLSAKKDGTPFVRKIKHTFYSKENDWGFSNFMSWNEIFEKGYVQDDSITLEVYVNAEAPHGAYWNSKKYTGYVGLKNQGATCYMNSLLQTLYFTNHLRKAVYKMPTEADDSSKSVALALQRVFHELQTSDKPVGTKKLTKSFGWETLDSLMQHDVQEFLRVLLDKLEMKMKNTSIEGTIPKLFEGKMISYIKCKNVDYTSTKIETFYDIQLNIKGKKNIDESFKDYISTEVLDGDNKYDAGEFGLQAAEKGVIFSSFPPILHLHLMRFQYDPITDNSVKFNDRFEFYEKIKLDEYLKKEGDTPATYILHAVLVHSGDNHGGHYVVFINPKGNGDWCKFDDDVVSRCTKNDAITQNYGGNDDDDLNLNVKHCSNAYMLVYIRESELERVLQEVTKKDIPFELAEKLEEEKQMEAARRRERSETSSYTTINVLLEDYLENHEKTDLCDFEHVVYRSFKIKKCVTVNEMMEQFAETFKVTPDKMRIWPVRPSQLQYTRFGMFDVQENGAKKVSDFIDGSTPWIIFLQLLSPDSEMQALPAFNKETDVLLFFKCYDSHYKRLNYCGLQYCDKATKFSTLIPELNKRAGYAADTELRLYEEKSANTMEPIANYDSTIEQSLNDLTHGFVIIFEKKVKEENLELPTVVDYINDLMCRHEITFVDKTNPNDTGFVLILSERTNYDQLAEAVGQRIGSDPYQIQFFKCQNFKDTPGRALSCTYKEKLNEMLLYNRPKSTKKIFYQRLTMNINELERKKQFKCLFLSPNMKDETELVLYLSKTGTVKTLLDEAAKVVKFSENGTKRLRISEISSHKILPGPPDATSLDNLQVINDTGMTMANQKVYRLEEIPNDELTLNDNEMLLPVVHFYKDVFHTFGIPFFVKLVNNEPLTALKERIQKKLNLPDKEWDNYKLARIVAGNAEYMNDDKALMEIDMFQVAVPHGGQKPFLGLEHINKSQKRSRFNYFEKAIKIYN